MNRARAFIRSRYPWALAAGLVLAAAFPNLGVAGFAWIAPGLILFTAIGQPPKQAFRLGYVAGLAHYLASLYWLLLIPVAWAPILGWTALSAFLALYPAVWVWLCWKSFPVIMTGGEGNANLRGLAAKFLSASWSQRTLWTLTSAAIWVALEMTVARFLSGFPWNLLGSSQFKIVPLIQIAAYTGVYGVSFLVMWGSLSLLGAVLVILHRPAMRAVWLGEIILPMTLVVTIYGCGYHKLSRREIPRPELSVALVQPSIPQSMIWDETSGMERFQQLLQLSESALTNHPDLLIWPEAAVPGLLRRDVEAVANPIYELARKHKVWLIIGADDAQPHPNAKTWADADFFNSSFLISPEGKPVAEYIKRNLVIFGEYIPLVRQLPFLKYVTPIESGFTPGDHVVPFKLGELNVKVSVLICFEDVFPHLAREYADDDTDFLVNLTNNGWFGEGAAQRQHAAAAIFRAVENGLPLVRCSNNGLTCWVDSYGRIRQEFDGPTRGIYGPGFLLAKIPLLLPGEKRVPTFYHQHGDLFGWACVGIPLCRLLQTALRRMRTQNEGVIS